MSVCDINLKSVTDEYGRLLFDVSLKEGTQVREKRISPEDFCQMILSAKKEKVDMEEVELLPREIVKAWKGGEGDFRAIMVFPAKKRGFCYCGIPFFIPFPAMVMKVSYKRGVREYATLHFSDTDTPGPDTVLYRYPFGNVQSSADGFICFGNIAMDDIKGLSDLPKVFDYFIGGNTNDDYFNHHNNKRNFQQGKLIKELEKLEVYPVDLMVPARRYQDVMTFKDLF